MFKILQKIFNIVTFVNKEHRCENVTARHLFLLKCPCVDRDKNYYIVVMYYTNFKLHVKKQYKWKRLTLLTYLQK